MHWLFSGLFLNIIVASADKAKIMFKNGNQMLNELTDMIDNIPENRPLYKDSGRWQVRSDDMEEVLFQQKVNESFYEFIKRVFDADNSYMDTFM